MGLTLIPLVLVEVCYAQLHRWHAVCPQHNALNGVTLKLRKVWLEHVVRVLSVARQLLDVREVLHHNGAVWQQLVAGDALWVALDGLTCQLKSARGESDVLSLCCCQRVCELARPYQELQ